LAGKTGDCPEYAFLPLQGPASVVPKRSIRGGTFRYQERLGPGGFGAHPKREGHPLRGPVGGGLKYGGFWGLGPAPGNPYNPTFGGGEKQPMMGTGRQGPLGPRGPGRRFIPGGGGERRGGTVWPWRWKKQKVTFVRSRAYFVSFLGKSFSAPKRKKPSAEGLFSRTKPSGPLS